MAEKTAVEVLKESISKLKDQFQPLMGADDCVFGSDSGSGSGFNSGSSLMAICRSVLIGRRFAMRRITLFFLISSEKGPFQGVSRFAFTDAEEALQAWISSSVITSMYGSGFPLVRAIQ